MACVLGAAREERETGAMGITSGVFGTADAGGSDEVACADRPNEMAGGSSCANMRGVPSSNETI
nr:hypothetical protein [uncultured Campylobacter sp.]